MKDLLNGANDKPLFYEMDETCKILKRNRKTIEKLVEQGSLRAFNLGTGKTKVLGFTPEAIYDFINGDYKKQETHMIKQSNKIIKSVTLKKSNPFTRV